MIQKKRNLIILWRIIEYIIDNYDNDNNNNIYYVYFFKFIGKIFWVGLNLEYLLCELQSKYITLIYMKY